VLAVQYPVDRDEAREVEIRGLARLLGMTPEVSFDYAQSRRGLPNREIELKRGKPARVIRVPRGHWFIVHPRPRGPLFEVLSDEDFHAAFGELDRSAESEHDLAAAVAAEAHWKLGRYVPLRYLDANDFTTGAWAHPAMQAVVTSIRAQLHERDAELWEQVDPDDLARWDRNRAQLPVPCQVRPEQGKYGHHLGSTRHAIVASTIRGRREHAAGRALCETKSRPKPMPVGPITVAPPDCPRCLDHLRSIAGRHGHTFEEPPPAPLPPADDSDKVSTKTPTLTAALPDLGDEWQLAQYTDPDRWWLHQHDRIRGYIHRYTNLSGNKTGWQAFVFTGRGHYMRLYATSAGSNNSMSSFLWRSLALAAWGIATTPKHNARNPAWTRNWRAPRPAATPEITNKR
jgi:hypothetical protein